VLKSQDAAHNEQVK
jgi:translation elongation factor EF-Ts